MKKAYLIGHIKIKNLTKWEEYKSKLPNTLEGFNHKLLFRGDLQETCSGTHTKDETVVIEFKNLQEAKTWHDSKLYQDIVPIRLEAADVDLMIFEQQ
jgi:uncharacterized protein (DUF1330 family)